MKHQLKDKRRDEIMDIAVQVLSERGYRDTSMLEIAKRASASKETLYTWFNDKQGLFEAIIQRNAKMVQATLIKHLETAAPIESVLSEFGCELLELLLGDESVAINRAAITESPSDLSLAESLARGGRNATMPILAKYLQQQIECGVLIKVTPSEAAEDFLGLLLTDKQVRRLLGLILAPTKAENRKRSLYATKLFLHIYASE